MKTDLTIATSGRVVDPAGPPDATPTPAGYRLCSGVARVRRGDAVILVTPEDGRALRMTAVGEELLPLLAVGAAFDELAQRLRQRHPDASDIERKLAAFIEQLTRTGMVETTPAAEVRRRERRRFGVFQPDPAAAWLARCLRALPAPMGWGLAAAVTALALGAILALLSAGRLPHPSALWTRFDPQALALAGGIFLLLVLPLHEAAHAVACRLAGQPVVEAGWVLQGLLPSPYVDTSGMYRVASRGKRFAVAAVGPWIDLLAAGGAAGWLLQAPLGSAPAHVAWLLFLLCTLFVVLDTNPLTDSDGSRMVEAWLGDDLARRSALTRERSGLSSPKTVATYRVACSVHLQSTLLLLCAWWRWTV